MSFSDQEFSFCYGIPMKVIKRMRERSSTNSQINPFTSNLTVPRDEREPRKRISAEAGSIDSIGWLAKIRKLNQQSNPPKTAIRVTPLRPVCLLHPMYYQDEEKDYKAPEFPQVIKEFCADISVDLSTIEWKNYETVEKLLKECDEEKFAKFMNSQFYKTVWHSSALDDSAGKSPNYLPPIMRQKAFQHAFDRAWKLQK